MFGFKLPLSPKLRQSLGLDRLKDMLSRRRQPVEKLPVTVKLGFEALEDRILPAVTPTLNNGVLAIAFSAANDTATISVIGSSINVFDGTTNTAFASTSVHAINVQGNGLASQSVTFTDTVSLTGSLTTSSLTNVTLNGDYTVSSANLAANGTISLQSGSTLAATGNVALTATPTETYSTVQGLTNFFKRSATAAITIGAATLSGQNITVEADAENGSLTTPNNATPLPAPASLALGVLQSSIQPAAAGAMLSTATATLSVGSGSNIQASGTVALTAKAVSNATTSNNAQGVGVAFGSSQPTATVTLVSGASVVSGGDFAMTAVANNTLSVTDLVQSGGSVNVSLAYGYARTVSSATVQSGATVQAPDVSVIAQNTNSFATQAIAAGFNQSGSAGVGAAVAVGDYQSTAIATVSGQVSTPGTATINAQSVNSQNLTRSFGAVSTPVGSSSLLTAIQNYVAGTTLPTSFNGTPISFTGTGPLSIAVGGAVTVVASDNTASASLSSGGQVTAGTMTVSSTATDNLRLSATSSAGDSSQDSVGGAVAVSSFTNEASAFLGNSAIANVTGILTVTATANVPNQVTAFTPTNPAFPTDSATGSARVAEQSSDGGKIGTAVVNALTPVEAYLNSILEAPTQIGTSFVDASGTVNQGDGVGVGGSVNILNISNTANAYVGQFAKVNQNATGTTQDVIVTANGTMQTVDPAGLPSTLNFSNGGGVATTAVGGSLQVINNTNDVSAYIADGAQVSAGRDIKVTANSTEYLLADTQGGSAAGSVGVDGAMSYVTLTNNTLAYIEDEATVHATHDVDVSATNSALDVNLQGGLAQGAVVGVGVSAGLTAINGTTQAVIGNVNGTTGTPGSVQAGDNVNLTATSTENVWTVSVSGATSPGIRPGSGGTQQFSSQNFGYGLAGNEEYGFGVSGDVAFNLVTDNTSALINTGATVAAANDIYLTGSDTPTLIAGAGAVAFGNDAGIGGSFAANDLSQTTQALTQNAVIKNTANVSLYATANVEFVTLSNGASGAKQAASVAGSVNLEILTAS